ncbi:LysR family transcriptional regulator [Mesorhizobium sp. M1050]|uniref:LysR family transcriptional regulator n=1 Tax=Mesorhizobium sp. M1050 TaxID=2957051 RepID=UPI003335BBC2
MTVDLLRMRQFVAVAEELHFGRAAVRLGMAQPPLSQAIKRLEADLGFPLFERTRRVVSLTAAGRVFLEEARQTLIQAEEAIRMARRAASDDLAELSINFVSAALYRVLPAAIRAFRRTWPDATIRLDERPTDAQLADLERGAVDLGFLHPPLKAIDGLENETMHRDRLLVAVSSTDLLSTWGECRIADLASKPFILFPYRQGPSLHARITQACRRAGFLPRIAQEARQMHTILSLVAAGLGVSLVPEGARTMQVDGVAFVLLTDAADDLAWELAVAWRPRGARRALRDFVETTRAIAADFDHERRPNPHQR